MVMKKLFIGAALIGMLAARAVAVPLTLTVGGFDLQMPLKEVAGTYLYDGINQKSLVGAESPVIKFLTYEGEKIARVTIGGVTSTDGKGTPFIGGDIDVGYLIKDKVNLGPILVGGFGGRNFNENTWMAGFKASIKLW